MWYTQALEIELRIEREVWSKIGPEKFVVFGFEYIQRERAAVFFDRMDRSLEFGKHGLAK